MSEVPICVGLKPTWKGKPRSFRQVSCKPLLTFASRCDATVELCNTRGLRLLRSSKGPENGAPGSLERTADLWRAITDNYWQL
jgi:hypothetical protein